MPRTIDLRNKSAEQPTLSPVKAGPVLTMPARTENKSSFPREFFWEAPLFYHNSQKKYFAFTVIAGLFAGAGAMIFFHKNTLTVVSMIMSALVLILYTNKKSEMSQISINELGISIDNQPYSYKELKSFWIEYALGDIKELSLESKKWYLPYIKISIENQNPMELRAMLSNFLPEKEHEVSLIDLFAQKLGM